MALLRNGAASKGTAYSWNERRALGLEGLLPPAPTTLSEQVAAMLKVYRSISKPIVKRLFLDALRTSNETVFFRLLMENVDEILPVAFTPTVGDFCKGFSHFFRFPHGMFLSLEEKGRLRTILDNAPCEDVDMIVVTDGERILGLGDLGINGYGMADGQLLFYTVCAGVPPEKCLAITLDAGTDREHYLNDPGYLGHRHKRIRGKAFDDFIDEFLRAVKDKWPHCALQFVDFGTKDAFRLLDRYQNRYACFSDNIQGTAGVVLAGFYSAARVKGTRLRDERILFLGAGKAATGSARLLVEAMAEEGLTEEEALSRIFLFDEKGPVSTTRDDVPEHLKPFAKNLDPELTLEEIVGLVHPTALIGLSTCGGAFTEPIVRRMADYNERPVIFALSNPTRHSECKAAEAYEWTDGRALFCSGSPFPPVEYRGKFFIPRQANNYFISPGIGIGALLSGATGIPPKVFILAARIVSEHVPDRDLALGSLFPPSSAMREISREIAVAVIRDAMESGRCARTGLPEDLGKFVSDYMYKADYR
ncbi:MAG: NAD-dependent malic enzyme [Sutterellaceae bacterium]|nr:NAD-dependent malic enzyme [Sutterellaceae bacterium]